MEDKIRPILQELHKRFDSLYGSRLLKLVLYGSHARGDAQAGSDIDVLVVLNGPVSPGKEIARTIMDVADVSLAHNEVIACLFVSEEEYEHEQSPVLLNIRREGVPV